MTRFLRLGCLLFFALLPHFAAAAGTTAGKAPSGSAQYQTAPTPAWVVRLPGSANPASNPAANGATQILLSDIQVNLLGAKPVSYSHNRSVALERAGLEQVSSLRIAFNPRFETLTLHELAVFRDGQRIERLKSSRIDVAQRERRLEEGIYDEAVEAIVAINDVRVGDVVEYAYSISGANPVFGGKFASLFGLDRDQAVARLAVRIQYPASRQLHYRLYRSSLPVAETTANGVRTLSLNAEALPPLRLEQGTPSWFSMYPFLQVSEYERWEDVNAWARTLYAVPHDLSPEIEAVVERIRAEGGTPQQQVMKALAWVQNEIRYYSVAVGTSSHRPNHPNLTVSQRFGDCKDKSLLLSAMLQRLGLQAEPALVSTTIRKSLADLLPTPLLFDHVIVRLQLGEQTYWLDGTQTYQGTVLETLGFTPLGKALPAATPGLGLVDVVEPAAYRNGIAVSEIFKVVKYGAPVRLLLKETYSGLFAEHFRRRSAGEGIKRFVDEQVADYGKDFPNIVLNGEAVVDDNPQRNTFTLTLDLTVPQLFSYEGGRAPMAAIYARSIAPWLRFPGTPERRFPLEIPHPVALEHQLAIDLPNPLPGNPPAPTTWQDRHLALNNRIQLDGKRLSFNYSVRSLQDHVAPADYPDFAARFKRNGWPLLFSSLQAPTYDSATLRARLIRDFERSGSNFRDPDQVDNMQQKFMRDYAVADETLRGGLVDGTLLAAVYRDRAEAASQLGRRDEALADVKRALQIEANDAGQILKAEIELYSGRYRDALLSLQAIRAERERPRTLNAAGMAHFYLEDYAAAQRSFAQAAEVAEAGELPYTLIWLAVAARKNGQDAAALVGRYRNRLATGWPVQAIPVVLGESPADGLLAAARKDDKESRARLCEAYFYLGQTALIDGKPGDAKRWFAKSVDTRVVMYREHTLAEQELRKLEKY